MIGYVTGEHWCAISITRAATSGSPVAAPCWSWHSTMSSTLLRKSTSVPTMAKSSEHAWMIAVRASSGLKWESMTSTTSLRPAKPPFAFTCFANASTATGDAWKIPGRNGFSSSAITAIRISESVMPISVASGCGLAARRSGATSDAHCHRHQHRDRDPAARPHAVPPGPDVRTFYSLSPVVGRTAFRSDPRGGGAEWRRSRSVTGTASGSSVARVRTTRRTGTSRSVVTSRASPGAGSTVGRASSPAHSPRVASRRRSPRARLAQLPPARARGVRGVEARRGPRARALGRS